MPERERDELNRQLLCYRALEREVNDPLATALVHEIVLEVEQQLQNGRGTPKTCAQD
jgi:hypothetical protein